MLPDAPVKKDKAITQAIATDNSIKIPNPAHNVNLKEEQIWLDKAAVACTQILDCIKNGLSEEDGLVLAGITMTEYEEIRRRSPEIVRMIEKEKVLFKLELMRPIATAIKNGDTSKAMWIAERKFPAEFGSTSKRVVNPPSDNSDPLSDIIARIQDGQGPGSTINKEINNIQHNDK